LVKLRIVAISSILGACALLSALTGCDSPRTAPRGADNLELHTGKLKQANPLEIAVLPVQNNTGAENVPLDALRRSFHHGLVRQRYTPLALEYVDSKIVEASYTPGEANENAILQVFVTRWDDSRWKSSAELRIDGEVYLLGVGSSDPSKALWGGKFSRSVSVLARRQVVASDGELMSEALQQFADDVLASLPARNPEQAP
jgi:hypothetical protein